MEADMRKPRRHPSLLRFVYRLVVGVVLVYAPTSLCLGGTPSAKPVFCALAAGWAALLGGHRYLPGQRLKTRLATLARWPAARVCRMAARNLAMTLVLAEATLRAVAAWTGGSLLVSDSLDAHRLVPGHDYGGGLRGNRLGYPGREFERDRQPGVSRIAALGDSFAVGPAVPFADNSLTLLETALLATEVYNFGVSGAGPREYRAILGRDVWTYQPDFVLVLVFVGNDITETLATPRHLDPSRHALYLFLSRGWRLAREHWRQDEAEAPGPSASDRPAVAGLSEALFREVEARRLEVCLSPPPPALEKKWQRALDDLQGIVDDCRGRSVPVGIVLIPDEFQVNPAVLAEAVAAGTVDPHGLDLDAPQRRLAAFCGERGVPCLDLKPVLAGVPDTYAPRDTHWNVRGNRLAADAMAAWLRRIIPASAPPPPTP
jgi:hypothetical protein